MILSICVYFLNCFAHDGALEEPQSNVLRYGIDISSWQSTFNGKTAKSAGLSAVFIRAGYGTSPDSCFASFTASASAAGLLVGSYLFATFHYSTVSATYENALANAKTQANFFVKQLRTAKITTYCACDLEFESGKKTNLNGAQLTECVNVFLDVVKAAGFQPIVYSGASLMFDTFKTASFRYPLWCAYYFKYGTAFDFQMWDGSFPNTTWGNRMKQHASNIKMWQFTSEGFGKKYGCGSTNLDKDYMYY